MKIQPIRGPEVHENGLFENKRNRDILLPLLPLLQFLPVGLKVPLWVVTLFEPPPLLRFVCFAGTSRRSAISTLTDRLQPTSLWTTSCNYLHRLPFQSFLHLQTQAQTRSTVPITLSGLRLKTHQTLYATEYSNGLQSGRISNVNSLRKDLVIHTPASVLSGQSRLAKGRVWVESAARMSPRWCVAWIS